MRKYSSFLVSLVLPMMGNILVESCLTGNCGLLPAGLVPEMNTPKIDPEIIPTSCLPACSKFDAALFSVLTFNAIIGTKVIAGPKGEKNIAPCEVLKFFGEMDRCKGCDLSFVVLILAFKEGKTMVAGQGLRMKDGTILAIYYSVQFGTNIQVKFPCGATRKVKCIKSLKGCSKNVLSVFIYAVRLELEEDSCTDSCRCTDLGHDCCMYQGQDCCMNQGQNCAMHQGQECCDDHYFAEPKIGSCKQFFPVSGCLFTPRNGNCTDYDLISVSAYLLPDSTGEGVSIVVPDDPKKFKGGIIGSVFMSDNCEVLGMVVVQPLIVAQTAGRLPLANQVATTCGFFVLPIDCFED